VGRVCSGQPVVFSDRRQAMRHAACSQGGVRDIGFWPRQKISMMRMGPPQQGHGSRRVSGMTSATASSVCGDCSVPSSVRIFAILVLRAALASYP
tara:strand:- start:25 stop:309 length:285 start_codon:yes stop_codon:yes gene_type:complete